MKYEKILHDERVLFSLKALYIFCMEHKDDENFTIKQILNSSPHKECHIQKQFIKLEQLGYIKRARVKSVTPNFMNSQWIFKDFDL